jgi:hypothetical protein
MPGRVAKLPWLLTWLWGCFSTYSLLGDDYISLDMKKYWLGLLVPLLLVGSGCKKVTLPGFTTFEVQDSQTVVLPAGQVLALDPIAITSNAPAAYAANNTNSDYVQNVKSLGGSLTILDPAGQTFDALTGVKVSISATPGGQDQVEVGSAAAVAAGASTLALAPGTTPIDMFVRQPTYYLLVRLEPGQALRQPTTLRVTLKYSVRARFKD